jgi:carboxymethylenebutenolidase
MSQPGFAQAVQNVAQTLIQTDAEHLSVADIELSNAAGKFTAYTAQPKGDGPFPVVLLVHEIFAVHEHIRDVARRLAKLGYLVVAPDLFIRQGEVKNLASFDEIRPIVYRVPDAQVLADLDTTLEWAVAHGGDGERIAITGFCWGGRIAWLYAAHQPRLKAAVAWYGRLTGEPNVNQPQHPINVAAQLYAPVLGLYGGEDTGISLDSVSAVQAVLSNANSPSRFIIYPTAPHAFYADYRPSYHAAAAKDGWQKLQNWFQQHGV